MYFLFLIEAYFQRLNFSWTVESVEQTCLVSFLEVGSRSSPKMVVISSFPLCKYAPVHPSGSAVLLSSFSVWAGLATALNIKMEWKWSITSWSFASTLTLGGHPHKTSNSRVHHAVRKTTLVMWRDHTEGEIRSSYLPHHLSAENQQKSLLSLISTIFKYLQLFAKYIILQLDFLELESSQVLSAAFVCSIF